MNEEKRKFVLMYLLRLDLHQMRIEYIRRSNDIIYQYLDMYSIEYAKSYALLHLVMILCYIHLATIFSSKFICKYFFVT